MALPRNLARQLPCTLSKAVRPLSTYTSRSNITHRSPSLADLTPDSFVSYRTNLAAYRDKVKSATAESAGAGKETKNIKPHFTASFLTVGPKRLVKSLYASPTSQAEDEMEQSYGKVLARGKYVHEIVLHRVKPERVAEYVELIGEEYPRIAEDAENNVHLVGSWKTEIGDADTFGRPIPVL